MKLNGIEKNYKNKKGKIVNFNQLIGDLSPLMLAFFCNKEENYNLNSRQFDYLIQNSDLNKVGINGWSALNFAITSNLSQNLNLNKNQWDYLIKNSDLKKIDQYGDSFLHYALMFNKSENLNLTNEQWKYVIDNSDLSLIKDENQLIKLKEVQSRLLNAEILNKIDIKEENQKLNKL